jgi:hypothetical protein
MTQPLMPIPQPRLKINNQKTVINKDLFLLGDPGTPPPPPPPIQQNNLRPATLNLNILDNSQTDFDLLGNPGTPPTPPPVLFNL